MAAFSSSGEIKMESFQPVRLAYDTYKPVSGADQNLAPIIYLHGLTGFKEYWEDIPQIVANATNRLSYCLDARNHGDSEWSDEFNFDLNVDDLIHFMDTLGIKKAVIVGHSMGGITAIRTALRMPDRVEKIVVEDMYVQNLPQQTIDGLLAYLLVLRKALAVAPSDLDEDGVKKYMLKNLFSVMPPEMKAQTEAGKYKGLDTFSRLLRLRRGADGRHTLKCNLEVIQRSLLNTGTLCSEPEGVFEGAVCFIFGKISPYWIEADEQKIKQFFPRAVVEVIDEAGHEVHISKPLEFTDILLKFVS